MGEDRLMRSPMVSVIMAAYNSADHLQDAVDSILSQTFGDFEFVIVNDGSTDRTREILDLCAETDSRITVIHQENRGLPASLNRAISGATGKYLARMDADDISLPERLEKQVEFMESHPEVGLCGTACRMIGDADGVSWTTTSPDEIRSRLLFWPCLVHPTVMMRRELVADNGLQYDTEFKEAEDYELWTRVADFCKLANLPEVYLLYRVTSKQKTARFEDDVTNWSALIQRRLLEKMGVEPSPDEMDIHVSLHKSRFERSRDYVDRVEQWLCKLIEGNRATGYHEPEALAVVLQERWNAVCSAQTALGFWAWRTYISSPICRHGGAHFIARQTGLYSRRVVSSLLNRSGHGRALKSVVRRIKTDSTRNGGKQHGYTND
jgi:glycosyltransferase involved in cell wall biosynthesis